MSSTAREPSALRPAFVTTRWTEILKARGESPEARLAMGQLCEAYWQPVFQFIRRCQVDEEAARDLTQDFFARLLARGGLEHLEQGRGRFRSYLLGAVKHFLSDQQDRAKASKRGGGETAAPLELGADTQTSIPLQVPDPAMPVPDAFFDRHWAFNVIERALGALAAEFVSSEKYKQFETLKPWLVGDVGSLSQEIAARELGLSEGAVKVTIHRLRKRFRELVKTEIAGTVDGTENIQTELKYLLEVLTAA